MLTEPLTGRLTKFGGELQIIMRAHGADVTQIRGQMRQLGGHFGPLRIPALQRIDGETVPQVMQPGLHIAG